MFPLNLEYILRVLNGQNHPSDIDGDTCVHKFNAMRSLRPQHEGCRACVQQNYQDCERYKRIGNCEIPYSHFKL